MGTEVKENRHATNEREERLRPRRLEPDTLSYLKEVSEMLRSGDSNEEDVDLLMWNVLEEIAPRSASASSDRHACEMIEALFPKMSALQLRFFVSKMEGYFSHLWTNRYSSHVLQNLLSRCNVIIEQEISGLDENCEENDRATDTPTMTTIIINMVQELQEEWGTLMNDVSASHVWRSVFAVLAGKPLMPEKRGKNGKHRAISFGKAPNITYSVPESFGNLFAQVLNALMNAPADVLNNLMYDRNSGPVISMALKFAPKDLQQELIQHILEWKNEKKSSKTFYNFAGDSVTSHFLEAVFEVCEKKEFFIQLFERCLKGKLLEYSEDTIANYVIQHFIQCIPTKEVAKEVFEELSPVLLIFLSKGKQGIIWHLVELCVKFEIKQKELYELLFDAIQKQEEKKPKAVQKDFVPALLNLQLSTSSSKLTLNVTGARIIENLMKFKVSIVQKNVLQSLFKLNTLQLIALAKDSIGSRCIIEPIWETNEPALKWAQKNLYERFVGHFGNLALDRIGAFSVMKCYEKLELKQKAIVAEELLKVEKKLAGSHFSQLVLNTCHVYEFRNNREKWEALYSKKKKIEKLFSDVDADTTSMTPLPSKKKKKTIQQQEENINKTSKQKRQQKDDVEKEQESQKDIKVIFDVLHTQHTPTITKKKKNKKNKKQKQE